MPFILQLIGLMLLTVGAAITTVWGFETLRCIRPDDTCGKSLSFVLVIAPWLAVGWWCLCVLD